MARLVKPFEKTYEQKVLELVRARYSADEEFAILRKKLAGIDDKNEFEEYNAYVEQCKQEVK